MTEEVRKLTRRKEEPKEHGLDAAYRRAKLVMPLFYHNGRNEMADIQVTCINKTPRNNTHEGITHLGNSTGKWTRQQVIDWIENKTHTFFTSANGKRADIGVVNGANGKYLRTYADGVWNDNLLALPECG